MKLNWNLLGGEGVQTKNLPWGEYGYFLELHNIIIISIIPCKQSSLTPASFEMKGSASRVYQPISINELNKIDAID